MAITFNGSDDSLTIASALVAGQPVTYSVWVRQPLSDANHTVMEIGDGGSNRRIYIQVNNSEGLFFNVRQFSSVTMTGTASSVGDDVWTHLFATSRSATDHEIWTDGGDNVTETTSQVPTAQDQTAIGSSTAGATFWDGELAEVAFWNRGLTDAEAFALAKGFAPSFFRNGLVSYLPLIRNTKDVMGNVWVRNGTGGFAAFPHPPIRYPASPHVITAPAAVGGDPEGPMIGGKLVGRGILGGRLVA